MRSFAVAGLAVFLASIAPVAPVAAQTAVRTPAPGPVTISTCSGGLSSFELVEIATYDVTVRNTSATLADQIRLSALYGHRGKRATFDLTGPFPPGVDVSRHIHKTVTGGWYAFRNDRNDCVIDYVHFADGTSWGSRR